MRKINFFAEEIDFKLNQTTKTRHWISTVTSKHNKTITSLNYIFSSDDYLLNINQQYLNHNAYTDILTFDNSETDNTIEGDIFISIDRVSENAIKLNTSFQDELHRVMIHGILHLLGYADKTSKEKKEMRKLENHYLALRD